jgi:hypothetical protein
LCGTHTFAYVSVLGSVVRHVAALRRSLAGVGLEPAMADHDVYRAIVSAGAEGTLRELFSKQDFRRACLEFRGGTYNAFLDTHSVGNPGGASELFERVARGSFGLVRPLKYGLEGRHLGRFACDPPDAAFVNQTNMT